MLSPKNIIRAVLVVALCAFFAFYCYYQIIGIDTYTLETEPAEAVTFEKTVTSTGYILRSESVISTSAQGVVLSVADNNEKVSAGHEVANIYTDVKDADTRARLSEIEQKLEILENSSGNKGYYRADGDRLEIERRKLLSDMRKSKASNDLSDCVGKKDELLVVMNQISTLEEYGYFDDEIAKLKNERSSLALSAGGSYTRVYAPLSGYYSDTVDGFERVFNPDSIDTMTFDGFHTMINTERDMSLLEFNAGKIITDNHWYVMCELPKNDTSKFAVGKSYHIRFPYSYNTAMKMKLHKIISETDKSADILIFVSKDIPEDFTFARSQKIEIISESYSGLSVPKTAMRILPDGTKGVYILKKDTVKFRKIEEIYQLENDYIVRYISEKELQQMAAEEAKNTDNNTDAAEENNSEENAEEEIKEEKPEEQGYLMLYDYIIVGGKDLYHGKRIS